VETGDEMKRQTVFEEMGKHKQERLGTGWGFSAAREESAR
jgi:hypothetical protein